MKSFSFPLLFLLLIGAALPAAAQDAAPPTIVLVVRHAETEASSSNDPSLSEEGRQRARSLIETIGAAEVAAVYVSQFRRTRETAAPLAEQHAVPVTVREVSAATIDRYAAALADTIRAEHAGEVVVVVSHSNVVPQIVEALGGEAGPPIAEDEYDRLYVVVIPPEGTVRTIKAAY